MSARRLIERFYYADPSFIDGTTQFHRLLAEVIPPGGRILEVGAGPPNRTSQYLSSLGPVVGIDLDSEVLRNYYLTESMVFNGVTIPFSGETFDACVSNYVLEHVAEPVAHFQEVHRILKPGACYVFRTPNLWHYVSFGARLLPHWFHDRLANRLRSLPEGAHDPYPTVYRANTARKIRLLCRDAGFLHCDVKLIETEPSYGACSPLFFWPMMLYERLVNSTRYLAVFRANILGVARK